MAKSITLSNVFEKKHYQLILTMEILDVYFIKLKKLQASIKKKMKGIYKASRQETNVGENKRRKQKVFFFYSP